MIIQSLLDTDLYKFTMMQAVLHQYPGAWVGYRFKCRTPNIPLANYIDEISDEIDQLCSLRFLPEDLAYLAQLRYIKPDFIDFLELFHLDRKYIRLRASETTAGEIELEIQGPWLYTILFEVPLLAIINEVWFRNTSNIPSYDDGLQKLDNKIQQLKQMGENCRISDFGTRRRYSHNWHQNLIPFLRDRLGRQLSGSSNVFFSREFGLTPQGTMAHEWLQAFQGLGPRIRDSQKVALESWAKEYRGDLGIALSDVLGIDAFLQDFDMFFCKLFDGVRQDSGDPFSWGERILQHLEKNNVDPHSKILIFSDGLDVDKVCELYTHFKDRCKVSFGIGTNLTNDLGPEPIQIVIKMVNCNQQPVAKLSDSPSKNMCDNEEYLAYLRSVFNVQ